MGKSMGLSEIEAEADQYIWTLLRTQRKSEAEFCRVKLEGLFFAAQIKRVADLRSEWNASVGMREQEQRIRARELAAMEIAAGAADRAAQAREAREGGEGS